MESIQKLQVSCKIYMIAKHSLNTMKNYIMVEI